ncbi:MarR family winged helix-turn-helix transcriptional regulator [Paenibacillus sp. PAMC21692]|uniref:MarR family winged helix-turn-helix transcriptional regulator n=1 Tax=Paenibacillus sp. PAMC21692 TaxID=2762320 RepID=UPI00164EA097|nr:MarR family winged helix-turn-helix transcriptional regulator [Paenibacillus sp. PAMC21692]QNK54972.1 winged helix-turn-helix transcriptional regulator [Paenibacillus sp. PAMC21692]
MEDIRGLFQIMTRRFGFLNKNCCTAGGCDITLVQSHILYEIDRQHRPSIQQVSEALGTDITTFSRQIQALIKMNLVKKVSDPDDRRVQILSLTTEGKYVATTIDQQMKEYLTEVFSHMNDFEKETVLRSIKLLNDAMAKSSICCSTPIG